MTGWIAQVVSRVVAVIVAAFGAWLLNTFGIEMTTEQIEGITAGLTALGGIILLGLYGLVRPFISRWIDPKDSAEPAAKKLH